MRLVADTSSRSIRARRARRRSCSTGGARQSRWPIAKSRQGYPEPGWVEHDPEEIYSTTLRVAREALDSAGHHRSRTWRPSGSPTSARRPSSGTARPARRSRRPLSGSAAGARPICQRLKQAGLEPIVRERTGLLIDAYFSATKIAWLLENVPGARERAEAGELAFGTVDTWLLWKLTGGAVHVDRRDERLADDALQHPRATLGRHPAGGDRRTDERCCRRSGRRAASSVRWQARRWRRSTAWRCPIAGVAGDQQAALFGQACFTPGMSKNTYGTGSFLLLNTGDRAPSSRLGLLTTVAWQLGDTWTYALEGAVFVTGRGRPVAARRPGDHHGRRRD